LKPTRQRKKMNLQRLLNARRKMFFKQTDKQK
jgi:hypothetical protein